MEKKSRLIPFGEDSLEKSELRLPLEYRVVECVERELVAEQRLQAVLLGVQLLYQLGDTGELWQRNDLHLQKKGNDRLNAYKYLQYKFLFNMLTTRNDPMNVYDVRAILEWERCVRRAPRSPRPRPPR